MTLAAAAMEPELEPEAAEVRGAAVLAEAAVLAVAAAAVAAAPQGQAAPSGHMAGHMAAAVWARGHVQV